MILNFIELLSDTKLWMSSKLMFYPGTALVSTPANHLFDQTNFSKMASVCPRRVSLELDFRL